MIGNNQITFYGNSTCCCNFFWSLIGLQSKSHKYPHTYLQYSILVKYSDTIQEFKSPLHFCIPIIQTKQNGREETKTLLWVTVRSVLVSDIVLIKFIYQVSQTPLFQFVFM